MKVYVGLKEWYREVFRAAETPTQESHGHLYGAVIGPFRTKRGAEFMRDYGQGNPHCRCVADAELIARQAWFMNPLTRIYQRAQRRYVVNGELWPHSLMVEANCDDAVFLEWIETAKVGDVFPDGEGCQRVE